MVSCTVYTSTLLSIGGLIGLIGAFAIIKYPLSQRFNLSQSFLGMVDAINFLGRFIGGMYSIFFPFESLKLAYTVQAIINSATLAIAFILMYEVESSLVKPILLITMLISGTMRSLSMVPRILIYNNSNPQEDKFALSVWQVLFLLGDVVSLLLVNWLMELGLQENYAFLIFVGIYLLAALLQQFVVDERHTLQNQNGLEYIRQSFRNFRVFFAVPRNLLWCIENCALIIFYFNVMMWAPYYFTKIGFESQTTLISLMFPLLNVISAIIFSYIFGQHQSKVPIILILCFALGLILQVLLLFVGHDSGDVVFQIFCFGGCGFFFAAGRSWICGYEGAAFTEGNLVLRRQVILLSDYAKQIGNFISLLVIGFLVEHDMKWFIAFMIFNSLLFAVPNLIRGIWFSGEPQSQSQPEINSQSD